MFMVIRITTKGTDYFGPFPSQARAIDYSLSFDTDEPVCKVQIVPLIVPNCVTVKSNY